MKFTDDNKQVEFIRLRKYRKYLVGHTERLQKGQISPKTVEENFPKLETALVN